MPSRILALAFATLEKDFALMRLDDVLNQTQTQSGTFDFVRENSSAVKLLKDLSLFPYRDSDTTVAHTDVNPSILRLCLQPNRLRLR